MERTIRNAAKALIIKDDKMLAIKIRDNDEEWYIMPGGDKIRRNCFRRLSVEKLWRK